MGATLDRFLQLRDERKEAGLAPNIRGVITPTNQQNLLTIDPLENELRILNTGQLPTTPSGKRQAQVEKEQGYFTGGPLQKFADTLLVGNYLSIAAQRKVLESQGILPDSGRSFLEEFYEKPLGEEVLRDIGIATGRGGVFTGQYKASESIFANFIRELPRVTTGLTVDILTDPITYLGGLGVFKAAFGRASREASKLFKRLPQPVQVKGGAVAKFILPPSRFQDAELRQAIIAKNVGEKKAITEATALTAEASTLPKSLQQRISQVVRGGVTTKAEIQALAEPIRTEIDRLQIQINKLSPELLSEETITAGLNRYLGRFFTSKEFPEDIAQKEFFLGTKQIKVPKARFIARKDFAITTPKAVREFLDSPSEVRKTVETVLRDSRFKKQLDIAEGNLPTNPRATELKEIARIVTKEVPEATGKEILTAIQIEGFVRRNQQLLTQRELLSQASFKNFRDFFNERVRRSLGEIKEIALPAFRTLADQKIAANRLQFFKSIAGLKQHVSDVPISNFVQIPDDKLFGALRGKFVSQAVADEIMRDSKKLTDIDTFWLGALRTWKAFKTAYNPATIARNDITNLFILNPMGGVQPWRLDIYSKAIKSYTRKDEFFQRAEAAGMQLSTQEVAELRVNATKMYQKIIAEGGEDAKGLKELFPTVEKYHERVISFYGAQDRLFKLANFIKGTTEDGLSDFAAMQRANFYLIDYSDVPLAIDIIRKSPIGIPFISFTYGISFPLAKTIVQDPQKIANLFKVFNAIRSINPYQIPEETRDAQEAVLPDFMRNKPLLRLPYQDKFDNIVFLDMEYILPFNIFEMQSFMPGGPAVSLVTALVTNRDAFTGLEIVEEGSTTEDAWKASFKYVYQQMLPSLAPGGFGFAGLQRAITQTPERISETPRSIQAAVASYIGGLKTFSINPTVAKQKNLRAKRAKILQIRNRMRKIQSDFRKGFIDEQERNEELEKLKLRITNVLEGIE